MDLKFYRSMVIGCHGQGRERTYKKNSHRPAACIQRVQRPHLYINICLASSEFVTIARHTDYEKQGCEISYTSTEAVARTI